MRSSRCRLRRIIFQEMISCSLLGFTDVSDERAVSIYPKNIGREFLRNYSKQWHHIPEDSSQAGFSALHFHPLRQWYSTWGTRTPGGNLGGM
jgi:hypothetical protein